MRCVGDEPLASVECRPAAEGPAGWRRPNGYSLLSWEVDLRRGGASRLRVRSPDGRDQLVDGVQLEIVEPERKVFRGHPGLEGLHEPKGTFTFRRE